MSSSMWIWRVILPGIGLIACSMVLWQSSRTEGTRPKPSVSTSRLDESPGRVIAEGRIVARPGAEVTLGSEAGGTVLAVLAAEKARVRKGDVLVEFRSDDLRLNLADAEARQAEADADLIYNQGEHQKKSKVSTGLDQFPADLANSQRELQVSIARRRAADAAVGRARLALARAKVISTIDGVVVATYVEPGEIAVPGSRLVTICNLDQLRIEAEVDEFDVARITTGDDVVIKAEGYGDVFWRGTVEEIPDRVAARTLLPDDPGRPSDTRVLLVKIRLTQPVPLKLGQQVEVEIRPRPRPETRPIPALPNGQPAKSEAMKPGATSL
jgi:HlyD family secretion protein